MKILCAWVTPNPETLECLRKFSPDTQIEWIDPGDSYGYWNAVQKYWKGEEDLLIIEQDMVWKEGDIESLENCPRHWCVYEYESFASDDFTVKNNSLCLGFTKFSVAAQKTWPVEAIQENIDKCDLPCRGSWIHLDMHIAETLKHGHCWCCRKIHSHVHGTVTHLHDYKATEAVLPDETDEVDPANVVATLRSRGWKVADPSLVRIPDEARDTKLGKSETKVVNHVQRG